MVLFRACIGSPFWPFLGCTEVARIVVCWLMSGNKLGTEESLLHVPGRTDEVREEAHHTILYLAMLLQRVCGSFQVNNARGNRIAGMGIVPLGIGKNPEPPRTRGDEG